MAACPAGISHLSPPRRRLALTNRRLEANRRNSARSTGPRGVDGKARVARNAVKHGFFAATQRWTPQQHREYGELLAGLRDDFKPQSAVEENCVATMAESWVRMAAVMHYENVAALEYHQRKDREMDHRIATADASEAARLRTHREELRRAGRWRPMLPAPRETEFIIRCIGSLDRRIARAHSMLRDLQGIRAERRSEFQKSQEQTHFPATLRSGPEARRRTSHGTVMDSISTKQSHSEMPPNSSPPAHNSASDELKTAKTNPLTSMFPGNRHERRKAEAMARKGLP